MPETLTPAELAEITKKRRTAAQAAVLAKLGVPFSYFGHRIEVDRAVAAAFALLPERQGQGLDLSRVR